MSDINILLRNRESIKLQIQALESKKNSENELTGYEQAMLEDMYYQLLVIEKLITDNNVFTI